MSLSATEKPSGPTRGSRHPVAEHNLAIFPVFGGIWGSIKTTLRGSLRGARSMVGRGSDKMRYKSKVVEPLKEPRSRARDLGIPLGRYKPGRQNAITDVKGVSVGHSTIIRGSG